MKIATFALCTLVLGGCHVQSNITRTITRTDGSVETYTNTSDGYNYNPNFSGHSDSTYQIRSTASATQNTNANFINDVYLNPFGSNGQPLNPAFGGVNTQYTIR